MAELVIALDVPGSEQALALSRNFAGLPVWLKVGLELFTAEGPALARRLMEEGFPVFLDLKFHDIPNTVRGAVRSSARLGAGLLTLHATGGPAMAEAALEGRREALESSDGRPGRCRDTAGRMNRPLEANGPLLLAVTLLTSDAVPAERAEDLVLERALLAKSWGLDGVVCSGLEAGAVKAACGGNFICLCPGIRFAGGDAGDQARVCTPRQAAAAGADFLVMGRPILRASDPAGAAKQALSLMGGGLPHVSFHAEKPA